MKNSNKQNYCLFVFVSFFVLTFAHTTTNKTRSEIYEHMSILDTYKMLPHVTHSKRVCDDVRYILSLFCGRNHIHKTISGLCKVAKMCIMIF